MAALEFTYLGGKVKTSGGREAAVTARTRFEWLSLGNVASYYMERFLLKLKRTVYNCYARPGVMHWSIVWLWTERDIGILGQGDLQ